MSASEYCSEADIHDFGGLARGALPNPGRLVAEVNTTTNTLTLDGHGFATDSVLLFRSAAGDLPSPLVAGTLYYAIKLSESTFQVAAAEGGSALDLSSEGEVVFVVTPIDKAAAIQRASAFIDDYLPAHEVPITETPVPITIRSIAAQIAAKILLSVTGQSQAPLEGLDKLMMQQIDGWLKGRPIRGPVVPPPANLAVTSAKAGNPRDWLPPDGSVP